MDDDNETEPDRAAQARPAPNAALGSEQTTGFEQHALFGGRGTVRVWDLLGTQLAPPFSAVLSCELEAGGRVGEHVQQRDAEIVIAVAGRGVIWVNGLERRLLAGDVAHLPKGGVLAIENPTPLPFRYLIIKASAN